MRFTTVKRAISAVLLDGPDLDTKPEAEKVQGQVTFTPMLGEGDSVQVQTVDGPVTVVPTPITVRISDGMVMHRGSVGVQLFAGGEGAEPSLIRWRASFSNLQSKGVPLKLRDVVFDAVPDGIVDLTTAAPLANAPEPIIRGPQGVSISKLTVEGGDLVVWGTSESGTKRLSTVSMAEITSAAAQHTAEQVKAEFKATLDGKAPTSHTHSTSDVTGLDAALNASSLALATASFTIADKGSNWGTPSASRVPWATSGEINIRLIPGRYRLEAHGPSHIAHYHLKPWTQANAVVLPVTEIVTDDSGAQIFVRGGGTVFLTRLA